MILLDTQASEPPGLGALQLGAIADPDVVGVVLWDSDGRIHDANDRFLEMLGYGRDDLARGVLDWKLLTPDERLAHDRAATERLRARGIARAQEREYLRKDGVRIFARLHSAVLREHPDKAISIVVDVSEERWADVQQRSLMEREMQARADAEAAVRSRDDILAIVSHDLRNPLNIIAMSAALLDTALAESARMAQVGIIRRAVAGMNRLIGDLLDVTQITSGKLRIDPRPLDVSSICEDAHGMFAAMLATKSQRFECAPPVKNVAVMADRERISQVLSNLIGNAHKFTPEGGRIGMQVVPCADDAHFMVEDTGPGVSAQDLPHIFDRFWQARRVRRGGVGLGLPITKGIIDAHGGRIWAESAAGIGSTFHFTLPLAPSR